MFKEIVVSSNHSWRNVAVDMMRASITAHVCGWAGDNWFLDDLVFD